MLQLGQGSQLPVPYTHIASALECLTKVNSRLLQLLGLYLAGGLAGSISHVLWYWWKARNIPRNPWGGPSWAAQSPAALGASGAVNAIVVGDGAHNVSVFIVLLRVHQLSSLAVHCNEAAGASSLPLAAICMLKLLCLLTCKAGSCCLQVLSICLFPTSKHAP